MYVALYFIYMYTLALYMWKCYITTSSHLINNYHSPFIVVETIFVRVCWRAVLSNKDDRQMCCSNIISCWPKFSSYYVQGNPRTAQRPTNVSVYVAVWRWCLRADNHPPQYWILLNRVIVFYFHLQIELANEVSGVKESKGVVSERRCLVWKVSEVDTNGWWRRVMSYYWHRILELVRSRLAAVYGSCERRTGCCGLRDLSR